MESQTDVLLKLRVSGTKKQVQQRVAELVDQLDGTDDLFISVIDAVIEEPIVIRRNRRG
jgi:hypothetical protein